jgi:glucoamylase
MAQQRQYGLVQSEVQSADLPGLGQYLLPLMQRNFATDGFVFTDPLDPERFSAPGCIIASPSFERDLSSVKQNYVFNWTRDAAVAAIEVAVAHQPVLGGSGSGPLGDYVRFASTCQATAPNLGRACFTIEGQPRDWTDQNDGPALQTLAILASYTQLDAAAQDIGHAVVQRNLDFLMSRYRQPSYNLWEETYGQSFFTRAVQLRCLNEIAGNTLGFQVPAGIEDASSWLREALHSHWNGDYYVSILEADKPRDRYDPNIDIVMAGVYGAVDCTDTRLLASAATLRTLWTDPASPVVYPINQADAARGMGPLLGRYPGDVYDGNNNDSGIDHPWALCTANFAQLYFNLATAIEREGLPYDATSADFFAQVQVDHDTGSSVAAQRLRAAGDSMLQAIVYHSDHFELSEQFDGTTGFESSVRNLTWSYAAFLSALRARSSRG